MGVSESKEQYLDIPSGHQPGPFSQSFLEDEAVFLTHYWDFHSEMADSRALAIQAGLASIESHMKCIDAAIKRDDWWSAHDIGNDLSKEFQKLGELYYYHLIQKAEARDDG